MDNIVAHIYNEDKSIDYCVVNWFRVIVFPLALIEGVAGHRVKTVLTGRIIQKPKDRFVIERFLDHKEVLNTWYNTAMPFFKSIKGLFLRQKKDIHVIQRQKAIMLVMSHTLSCH